MKDYTYLIVGGGMSADAAVNGIRKHDADGSIAIITAESNHPYDRPPLTKGLWQDTAVDDIWRGTDETDVELITERTAKTLDTANRRVGDDQGETYGYDRLLLATGGTPKRLPFGGKRIIYYRTLDDYRKLEPAVQAGKHIAVLGGGFIGSELSAAIAMNDGQVTMLFPEAGIGGRIFPKDLAQFLVGYYREKGVTVMPESKPVDMTEDGDTLIITLDNGDTVEADVAVAGIGITPNDSLAKEAGLKVDDGIVVDQNLMTSAQNVFAAGDAANVYCSALETRRRVEHEDHALQSGECAGENMAEADRTYDYLPMFYSDLFDLGYEAVGETRADHDAVCCWQETYRKGIILYTQERQVRGALFWNVWDMVPKGRDLIARQETVSEDDLRAWCDEALSKD